MNSNLFFDPLISKTAAKIQPVTSLASSELWYGLNNHMLRFDLLAVHRA